MKWLTRFFLFSCVVLLIGAGLALRNTSLDLFGLRARVGVVDHGPTVVKKIQSLARLETVSFTEQKILEGRKDWQHMPGWLLGDKMMFVAHGEVVAGVDLSRFQPEHLTWEGEAVRVRLPEPQVFHVRLDNRASQVYHRKTGWLNRSDPQLETKVRQRADDALLSGALNEGILDHARKNAEQEIGRLLEGFGAKTVTFI